jgi:hypothetical protein
MSVSLEEQRKQTRIRIEEKIAGTSTTNSLIVSEAIKMIREERDRNLGLILALEECKWKAEDVVKRGYSEVSDAFEIIDIVKQHTENQ